MARLPNFENAFIDEIKLREYCLNDNHPVGKHKAKMFMSVLSLTRSDAQKLKKLILDTLPEADAIEGKADKYGKRFTVELKISNFDKQSILVTA